MDLAKEGKKTKRKKHDSRASDVDEEHEVHDGLHSISHMKTMSTDDLNEDHLNGKVMEKVEFASEKGERKKTKERKKTEKRKKSETGVSLEDEVLANDGRKNVKSTKNTKGSDVDAGGPAKKRDESCEPCENPPPQRRAKRVKFSSHVEVFPSDSSEKVTNCDDGLIRGKRFSKEEDELVKKAVLDYIEMHCLGEEGLQMVLNSRGHKGMYGCWNEIAEALPWRHVVSVYSRAHALFERGETRKWTQEELEMIRSRVEQEGASWKPLAVELGRYRFHVKDTWRRIKLANRKRGRWSQDEYQSLFDLVNMDLRMKLHAKKKTKHGMLRDNVSWTAISEKLSTRPVALCCIKWYDTLTSPMVAEGCWADTDDHRLLIALYELDANCEEDVNWDNLLEHRSGDLCRKRWRQMIRHIGDNREKSFAEQVEILSGRYCPDVLEPKEAYNNRTPIDLCRCTSQ
ncbi:hypothetical protein Dimus_024122 [Dionaea muscipula]